MLQPDEELVSCNLTDDQKTCVVKLGARTIEEIISASPETFTSGTMLDSEPKGPENEVEAIVENAKKRKAKEQMLMLESEYKFVKQLNENSKQEFAALNRLQKQRVARELAKVKTINESVVVETIENVSKFDEFSLLYSSIPTRLIPVFESLGSLEKQQIEILFARKGVSNETTAELFWESLDLESKGVSVINESKIATGNIRAIDDLGYSVDLSKV